uniref:Uncharacterized protein n=1 Tax=Labrus bergylta TaxID=56723 RepID=A0A3Q3FK71_9LABR
SRGRHYPGYVTLAGAGAESCRLRERLRAALAGLTELKLLKDRQRELVNQALRDRDEPGPAVCEEPEEPERTGRTETEERLEATLTALKQQLVRREKKLKTIKICKSRKSKENTLSTIPLGHPHPISFIFNVFKCY